MTGTVRRIVEWLKRAMTRPRIQDDAQPSRVRTRTPIVRALITGASVFVGKHLVAHLEEQGDVALCPESDITDRDTLFAEFANLRPEVVYHLAAQADVGGSWNKPLETLRVNVEGTLNVLDAARGSGASNPYHRSRATDLGFVRSVWLDDLAPDIVL